MPQELLAIYIESRDYKVQCNATNNIVRTPGTPHI